MYASDKTGLSDPYAIMSFGRYSTRSRIVKESLCPTWDQTMVISQIRVFGDTQSIDESPPPAVLEFFDKDQVVSGGKKKHKVLNQLLTGNLMCPDEVGEWLG